MAKNNQVIELAKAKARLEKEIKLVVPEVYACFCKALYDRGWNPEDIEDLFCDTQRLWNENLDMMDNMIDWCLETTGIECRGGDFA